MIVEQARFLIVAEVSDKMLSESDLLITGFILFFVVLGVSFVYSKLGFVVAILFAAMSFLLMPEMDLMEHVYAETKGQSRLFEYAALVNVLLVLATGSTLIFHHCTDNRFCLIKKG